METRDLAPQISLNIGSGSGGGCKRQRFCIDRQGLESSGNHPIKTASGLAAQIYGTDQSRSYGISQLQCLEAGHGDVALGEGLGQLQPAASALREEHVLSPLPQSGRPLPKDADRSGGQQPAADGLPFRRLLVELVEYGAQGMIRPGSLGQGVEHGPELLRHLPLDGRDVARGGCRALLGQNAVQGPERLLSGLLHHGLGKEASLPLAAASRRHRAGQIHLDAGRLERGLGGLGQLVVDQLPQLGLRLLQQHRQLLVPEHVVDGPYLLPVGHPRLDLGPQVGRHLAAPGLEVEVGGVHVGRLGGQLGRPLLEVGRQLPDGGGIHEHPGPVRRLVGPLHQPVEEGRDPGRPGRPQVRGGDGGRCRCRGCGVRRGLQFIRIGWRRIRRYHPLGLFFVTTTLLRIRIRPNDPHAGGSRQVPPDDGRRTERRRRLRRHRLEGDPP